MCKIYIILSLNKPNPKAESIERLKVHHNYFTSILKVFNARGNYFVSFQFMPFSLAQVVKNRLLDKIYIVFIFK